jgi:hypothetical protein
MPELATLIWALPHCRKSNGHVWNSLEIEWCEFDLVAELPQFGDHPPALLLDGFGVQIETSVHITNALV